MKDQKKWRILLVALALVSLALSLGSCAFFNPNDPGHTCLLGAAQVSAPTCTADGFEQRACIVCGKVEQTPLPATGHTSVLVAAVPATCTQAGVTAYSTCQTCGVHLTQPQTVPATGHTEVPIPETAQKTAGLSCSVCLTLLTEPQWKDLSGLAYENVMAYDSSYGYTSLSALANGSALCTLYQRIDAEADRFHLGQTEADAELVVTTIAFGDLGLSKEQALMVWAAYRLDRPLYYWISRSVVHTNTELRLLVDEEYKSYSVRQNHNQAIYSAVASYLGNLRGSGNEYDILLTLHDDIVLDTTYATDPSGQPSTANSAHNILGVLVKQAGVCESYARTYQLLLNFLGIENIYVTGTSRGEAHAWNMVKLPDGKWYWFDLTWDDQPTWLWGVSHNYFALSNTENTNWNDGAGEDYVFTTETFAQNHTPATPQEGIDYLYPLPAVSDTPYGKAADDGVTVLRESFVVDGNTYAIVGAGQVALTSYATGGDVTIPATVSYGGTAYTVTVVGRQDANGRFQPDSIFALNTVTEISIPATVCYIFLGAFNEGTLESVAVDGQNPAYTAVDGILYTKDLSTLVWIGASYSGDVVLPATVTEFRTGEFQYRRKVTSVTLSAGVTAIAQGQFAHCTDLRFIYYGGTEQQWNALPKGDGWNSDTSPLLQIICSDTE